MERHAKGKKWKRRWLFHATNFESLMYPCFIFCRILGIFPYKFKASIFETSKSRYILSSVVSCIDCVYCFIFIYAFIKKKIDVEKLDIIWHLQFTSYFTLNGFIVIIVLILSGARMRLLQIILETSSKLPPKSYQKMSKFIHAKDILITILRIICICVYFSKIEFKWNWYSILNCIFVIHSSLLELQINMLHINCVCVLKACFKRINDSLTHMQILMTDDVKQCDSRSLIYYVQRNEFLLRKLKNLMKWHLMVSDAVQMLNIIFSPLLLAAISITFSTVTLELYLYAVRWQDGPFFNFNTPFLDVFLATIIYNVIKITLLVWACETGKNRAQEIGTTIHDLLNSTKDEQIKKELQLFSFQILHRKNTFSVKGFTIDATFLATLVGNITTYELILIQFLNISHSCDKKTTISDK